MIQSFMWHLRSQVIKNLPLANRRKSLTKLPEKNHWLSHFCMVLKAGRR